MAKERLTSPTNKKAHSSMAMYYRALMLVIILVYIGIKAYGGGDFEVYLHAANKLRQHQNIYKPPFLADMPYIYSTFFALLLIPFTYLPPFLVEFGWQLANLFFLFRLCKLIYYYLDAEALSPRQARILFFTTLALTIRFLLYNFDMVQLTIFLMYASLESIYLIGKGKRTTGALLLGLAANIKILPLAMIPYLFYRKEFRAGLSSLAVAVALLFVPSLFIGHEQTMTMLGDWWQTINPTNALRTFGEAGNGPHGLPALIPTLLMKTTGELDYRRHVLDLTFQQVSTVLHAIQALLIAGTLYFLKTRPFQPSPSKIHTLYEISYLFLITPLIAPQQQKYAFFYILPAVAYVVYFLIAYQNGRVKDYSSRRYQVVAGLLFIVFLLTTVTSDVLIGRAWNEVTQYYRLITYGTLLLIVPLAMCKPAYIGQPGEPLWTGSW